MKQKNKDLSPFRVSILAALVTLSSLQAQAQDGDEPLELNTLDVTAEREGPVGPDAGYQADRTLTATKTDTPLSETPRSVSVATNERIEDQSAQTLAEILAYMPGVSSTNFPVGDALAGDIFYIRGFNQRDYGYGLYRDGLRVQSNAYSTSTEPYGLERVEVFRGPTSILYGENVPGGLVNLVSKRPSEVSQGEVNLSYGSYNRKQASADITGPLTDDGSVLGRLVLLARESDTQTDSVPDDRLYIAPSVTFKLTDRDTLTLLTSYQKDDTEIQLGLPAAGTLLSSPNGQLDTDTNLGHPEWDEFDREVWSVGYEYEHLFNDAWAFRQNARYLHSQVKRQEVWWSFPPTLPAIPGLLPDGAAGDGYDSFVLAYGRDRDNESQVFSIDNQVVGKFDIAGTKNTLLMGASFDKTSFDQQQYVSQSPDLSSLSLGEYQIIDIYDPVWATTPQTSVLSSDADEKQEMAGVYTQVQSRLGGLIGLLGGRFDYVETEVDNRLGDDFSADDHDFTWQAGLMYQFSNGLSPYLSYSTSFVPARQLSAETGEALKPITGDQYEVGVKYQPPGCDLVLNIGAFRIEKENDITWDPSLGGYRNVAQTDSEGVEVELVGEVNENLSLTASYTYIDARIKSDLAYPARNDNQVTGVPRNQASLWANYRFLANRLAGLETGLGIRYLGGSYAYNHAFGSTAPNPYGTLETGGVTLFDLAVGYSFSDHWHAGVNVKNVADKEFIASCNDAGRCYYGAERTLEGTVSYRW